MSMPLRIAEINLLLLCSGGQRTSELSTDHQLDSMREEDAGQTRQVLMNSEGLLGKGTCDTDF